ncbi:precursor of CEP9-like [Punica granatum]|uniref:Uncharacterized protein n=2 Tax=Punica granatum TaxID=22663 RepID=A0A218W1Q2_PUNGR|nr:precursor of CEP9-like [Punica granatum]OWM66240.1 hypothetical protein CDL15_Pgr013457 [Punica granatum]PKI50126.1 hypothetical protein CRG98_029450 [Punica granatum]
MASLLLLLNCNIALALFVSHALVLFAEGRPIPSLRDFSSISSVDLSIDKAVKKKVAPAVMALANRQIGFGQSDLANMDDFRPTNPGSSPGVGHALEDFMKKAGPRKGLQHINVDDTHPLTGSRTTGPGHSPGVGHAAGNVNSEPKV